MNAKVFSELHFPSCDSPPVALELSRCGRTFPSICRRSGLCVVARGLSLLAALISVVRRCAALVRGERN